MRNGKCSSCGAATVFAKENGVKIGEYNNGVCVASSWINKISPIVSFVCATCGYFENYINDRQKLAEVAQNWSKINPPPEAST